MAETSIIAEHVPALHPNLPIMDRGIDILNALKKRTYSV